MRVGSVLVVAALGAAACSGGADGGDDVGGPDTPEIGTVEPGFGPLAGGTRIVIAGDGFMRAGAAPNRVVIGDREAPLAQAIDDETLEVVIPEGDSPGAVDIVVYNANGYATLTNGFRYSEPPQISAVEPALLRYDQGGTVTLSGSGFLDENAGVLTVLVDGEQAIDVEVVSDTQFTFLAPPGRIYTRADIVVENRRGTVNAEGYEYGPGPQGGLLLFSRSNGTTFAHFFDPLSLEIQAIPRIDTTRVRSYHAVVKDPSGNYIGIDRETNTAFQIDLVDQVETAVAQIAFRTPDVARVGTTYYAIDRNLLLFGTLDLSTGALTQMGTGNVLPTGEWTLAADGAGTLFIGQRTSPQSYASQIQTISRTTGALGSPVSLNPDRYVTGMRFLGATLYGVTRNGELITINPATGATDLVANLNVSLIALETVP